MRAIPACGTVSEQLYMRDFYDRAVDFETVVIVAYFRRISGWVRVRCQIVM